MNLLQAIPHLFNGNILFVETEETDFLDAMTYKLLGDVLIFFDPHTKIGYDSQRIDADDITDYWIPTYAEGVTEVDIDTESYMKNELTYGLHLLFSEGLTRLERKTPRGTIMSVIVVEDIHKTKRLYSYHNKDLTRLEPFVMTKEHYNASWRYIGETCIKELGEGVGEV